MSRVGSWDRHAGWWSKILLPTLHKFFKMFHMIYTFLPQLSKKQSVECSRLVSKHKRKSETKIQLFPPQVFKFDLTQWYFFLHWNFNQNQSKDFSTMDIFLWHEGSTKIKIKRFILSKSRLSFSSFYTTKVHFWYYIIFSEVREKFVLFKSKYLLLCRMQFFVTYPIQIFELKSVSTSSRKSSV